MYIIAFLVRLVLGCRGCCRLHLTTCHLSCECTLSEQPTSCLFETEDMEARGMQEMRDWVKETYPYDGDQHIHIYWRYLLTLREILGLQVRVVGTPMVSCD